MFANIAEFLSSVKHAEFSLAEIWKWLGLIYNAIVSNSDLSAIWNGLVAAMASKSRILFVILILCFLCVAFFGRKIMKAVKFSAFLFIGFCLGTHYLAALMPVQSNIPSWLIGLVAGFIAAVLSRFLYVIIYAVFFGYGTYAFVFSLLLLNPAESYSDKKAVACLIIGVVAVVLAFVFRKYLEMAITAIFGAGIASLLFVNQIYDFSSWALFGGNKLTATLVLALILAAFGLLVQVLTRRRY